MGKFSILLYKTDRDGERQDPEGVGCLSSGAPRVGAVCSFML